MHAHGWFTASRSLSGSLVPLGTLAMPRTYTDLFGARRAAARTAPGAGPCGTGSCEREFTRLEAHARHDHSITKSTNGQRQRRGSAGGVNGVARRNAVGGIGLTTPRVGRHAAGSSVSLSASVNGSNVTLTWTNGAGALGANVFRDTSPNSGGRLSQSYSHHLYDTGVSSGTHTYAWRTTQCRSGSLSRGSPLRGGTPAPVVSGLTQLGWECGWTSVTVSGTNFTGATAVTFGRSRQRLQVNNATILTATAPAVRAPST